jgi:hypothetical protein
MIGSDSGEPVMDYLAVLKISVVVLIGICFFNAIIGVFGLSTAIVSLVVFVLAAFWIFAHSPRPHGGQ